MLDLKGFLYLNAEICRKLENIDKSGSELTKWLNTIRHNLINIEDFEK